jgi:hypothetical protein
VKTSGIEPPTFRFVPQYKYCTVSLLHLLFKWYRFDIFETGVKSINDNYEGRPVTPKISAFGDVTPYRMIEDY